MAKGSILRLVLAFAATVASNAFALNVVYDERTSEEHRKWADSCYVREQMEVLAGKICKALYGDNDRSKLHENFTIVLYLSPTKGGNPAFASGKRITWKVGEHPSGDPSGGMGLLCHEMTHVLDMGSDSVFTEAMADWTRNYKVNYSRCTNPTHVIDLRYSALRGGRNYGKYLSGANFVDYMTQTYGEGTIYKILMGYKEHGKDPWKKTFGKDLGELVAQWKTMQTIYDPVFQWGYNGSDAGIVRRNDSKCKAGGVKFEHAPNGIGGILTGASEGRMTGSDDGNMSIALQGRFGASRGKIIASLGALNGSQGGKAVVLATGPKENTISAVVVCRDGNVEKLVSTTPIALPDTSGSGHSIVLAVRSGTQAVVVVDGHPAAKIDCETKCPGKVFAGGFAVGGVCGGIGRTLAISTPSASDKICLGDVRVFGRTFRAKETKMYMETFSPTFRPGVAVMSEWKGDASGLLTEPDNWYSVNAAGEKIKVCPTKDTAVVVRGHNLPNVPRHTPLACKSFTVDGLAVLDANIDWRGVKIVDVEDNTRIITREHSLAMSMLRASRLRISGQIAIDKALKITNTLEVSGGSSLLLPANADATLVEKLAISSEGGVKVKPGAPISPGERRKILRVKNPPADLSRLLLSGTTNPADAAFTVSEAGKGVKDINVLLRR